MFFLFQRFYFYFKIFNALEPAPFDVKCDMMATIGFIMMAWSHLSQPPGSKETVIDIWISILIIYIFQIPDNKEI